MGLAVFELLSSQILFPTPLCKISILIHNNNKKIHEQYIYIYIYINNIQVLLLMRSSVCLMAAHWERRFNKVEKKKKGKERDDTNMPQFVQV